MKGSFDDDGLKLYENSAKGKRHLKAMNYSHNRKPGRAKFWKHLTNRRARRNGKRRNNRGI